MSSNLAADRHIANLVARYAELVDDGDFAGLGALFADASFTGSSASATGSDAVRAMFENPVITYADGTPRTKHVTTNLIIDVDEEAGTAAARSYFTVLQSVDGHSPEIIAAGRYRDRFRRHDGNGGSPSGESGSSSRATSAVTSARSSCASGKWSGCRDRHPRHGRVRDVPARA